MKKQIVGATLISAAVGLLVGWLLGSYFVLPDIFKPASLLSPLTQPEETETQEYRLRQYGIEALAEYPYQTSQLQLNAATAETEDYTTHLFSYQTLGKTMSGQVHRPTSPAPADGYPVVIMLRGWVPAEAYTAGLGTSAAAEVFAENGYVTLAPDFFGYGQSDPEAENSWEARFQKPLNVIELIKSAREYQQLQQAEQVIKLDSDRLALWGHSNGGQIALTTLEILREPIPTTLWAPVTAPFPYSILFYSDEHLDEGKEMRKWLSLFEENYDVYQFSLTKYLQRLTGFLQIHQGTADEAVPAVWNDEFTDKLELENERRDELRAAIAESTQAATLEQPLPNIEYDYYRYPGADHNLRPSWQTVVKRDLEFFAEQL